MKEIWRVIPSCNGYEASSLGQIRSIDREVWIKQNRRSFWKNIKGRRLKVSTDDDGYRTVNLSIGGRNLYRRVSRLVCEAFHGPCPNGMECLHGPGSKYRDCRDNVSWGTKSQNELNKRRDGVSNCKPVLRSDGALFDSISEAAESVGGNIGYLSCKLRDKYPNQTAYGYEWSLL